MPRATVPRATVPAHHRTAAAAVHVCIQQRPRPGASVTQDPGGHPPHLPRRGTRQGLHSSSQLRACVLRVRGCERAYVQPSPGRACVRGASRWSITSQCQRHASHGRHPAHSSTLRPRSARRGDARCLGLAGFDPEARARAAQPKRGRQPARPTRLARGVAAAATKKVAKILITFSPPQPREGQPRRGPGGEKSGAAEAEKSS